jgi:hypothetical protein
MRLLFRTCFGFTLGAIVVLGLYALGRSLDPDTWDFPALLSRHSRARDREDVLEAWRAELNAARQARETAIQEVRMGKLTVAQGLFVFLEVSRQSPRYCENLVRGYPGLSIEEAVAQDYRRHLTAGVRELPPVPPPHPGGLRGITTTTP